MSKLAPSYKLYWIDPTNPDPVMAEVLKFIQAHYASITSDLKTLRRLLEELKRVVDTHKDWLSNEEQLLILNQFKETWNNIRDSEKFVRNTASRLAQERWRREHPHIIISDQIKGSPLGQVNQAECEDSPESLEALGGRASQVKSKKARAEYQRGLAAKKPRDQRRAFCNALRLEGLAQSAPPPGNPKRRWKKPASEMLAR